MVSSPPEPQPALTAVARELVRRTANLRLAIGLLLAIAAASISGTLIKQGQSPAFYRQQYPGELPGLGVPVGEAIPLLGLDRVYSAWWFLGLLVLLGASLAACTFTRQLPALKAARRWRFYRKPQQFRKLALSDELLGQSLTELEPLLRQRRYRVHRDGDALYARKGLMGRIGPIVVHASMLLILAGAIWGGLAGFTAQQMIPSGETAQVRNIIEAGPLARSQIPQDWALKVNRFWIDYRSSGEIEQFYSDLSAVDAQGQVQKRQTIRVNEPFRYDGVTVYQTDWDIHAVKLRLDDSPVFELPMKPLESADEGQLWGTWVPVEPDLSAGISLLARDLQGTLLVYDTDGQLTSAVRPGMAAEVDGVTLHVRDLIGSTGLQIKADPGVPLVYAGFGLLMVGVVMSYVSHSQVWALQDGDRLYVGGKTNRAQVTFERELLQVLERLQQQPTPAPS